MTLLLFFLHQPTKLGDQFERRKIRVSRKTKDTHLLSKSVVCSFIRVYIFYSFFVCGKLALPVRTMVACFEQTKQIYIQIKFTTSFVSRVIALALRYTTGHCSSEWYYTLCVRIIINTPEAMSSFLLLEAIIQSVPFVYVVICGIRLCRAKVLSSMSRLEV